MHALLLFVTVVAIVYAAVQLRRGKRAAAAVDGVLGVLTGLWYLTTTRCPVEFVAIPPYVVTLVVLAVFTQRLRPPAADGMPWRKGQVE